MSGLGSQSFTNRITAGAFSQPFIQVGTLAAPLPIAGTTTIAYDPNYSKYVMYMIGPATTVAIATVLVISGAPVNLVGTSTITASTEWVCSGATPTVANVPVVNSSVSILNDTVAPSLSSAITLFSSSTGATFSSGSPILKLVININLD